MKLVPEQVIHPILESPKRFRLRPLWQRYGFAVVSVLAIFLITLLLQTRFTISPYRTFWVAIALTAWFGGFGSALVATFISIFIIQFFLTPPAFSISLELNDVFGYVLYILGAALISWLYEVNHRSEKTLIQQVEWFRITLTSIEDGVIATDVNGKVILMNAAATRITGWQASEGIGKYIFSVFNAQDDLTTRRINPRDTATMQKTPPTDLGGITIILTREGESCAVIDSRSVIRDATGEKTGIIFVFRDVTERRNAEVALKQSEERFRLMAEHAQDILSRYRLLPALGYEYVSPSSTRLTGYTPDEYYADPQINRRITHPDDLEAFNQVLFNLETAPQPVLQRIIHKDGRVIWMEYRYSLIYDSQGRVEMVETITRDITERKLAEERTRRLQEITAAFSQVLTRDQIAEVIIKGLSALQAYSANLLVVDEFKRNMILVGTYNVKAELLERYSILPLNHDSLIAASILDNEPKWVGSMEIYRELYPKFAALAVQEGVQAVAALPLKTHGETIGSLGIIFHTPQKFTEDERTFMQIVAEQCAQALERIRLYEAERNGREQFQITLASIGDAVIATDADGKIRFMNPVALQLTGWLMEEAEGKPLEQVFSIVNEETGESVENPVTLVMQTGGVVGLANHTLLIARDGTQIPIDDSGAPIRDHQGSISGVVLVFRDITQRKQQEYALADSFNRIRDLSDISRKLVAVRSFDDVLDALVASSYLKGIDQVAVMIFDTPWEDRIPREYEVIAALNPEIPFYGKTGERLRLQTHPLFELMSRSTVFVADVAAESRLREDASRQLLEAPFRTVISLPLEANGKWYGMLNIYSATRQMWTFEDVTHVDGLVDQVAVAVDNLRLLRAEARANHSLERANDRLIQLQHIAQMLSGSLTVQEVSEVIIQQAKTAIGVVGGSVARLADDGKTISLIYADGYTEGQVQQYATFSIEDPVPLADAIRTRHAVWISRPPEADARYAVKVVDTERNAWCAIPMQIEDRIIGGLGFSYPEQREFTTEEQVFILTLAQHCGQALERARLYDAEREASTKASANAKRLSFLARASELLASSLDYETTLQSVLKLSLPDICDWCVLHLLAEDGRIQQFVLTSDAAKAAVGQELQDRYPIYTDDPSGLPLAIRTGKSVLYKQVADEILQQISIDERHLEIQRELGIASSIIVPLTARDNRLGQLTMVSSFGQRLYNEDDLALAEDLGRRIGMAIDNARLHKQAQISAAVEERQRLARELHDAVTQTLFSASVLAESLPRLWERDQNKVAPNLERLVRLTRGALAEMRVLLLELRPTMILNTRLSELLIQLANAIQGQRSVNIRSDIQDAGGLPGDVHLAFYRITQESLNNIIKHSHASEAAIYLRSAADHVVLEVTDNGRGFDLDSDSAGFGLNNIYERAEAINAVLQIEGGVGKGTQIRVEWQADRVKPPANDQ